MLGLSTVGRFKGDFGEEDEEEDWLLVSNISLIKDSSLEGVDDGEIPSSSITTASNKVSNVWLFITKLITFNQSLSTSPRGVFPGEPITDGLNIDFADGFSHFVQFSKVDFKQFMKDDL